MRRPGIVLGIGLGGLANGILLHQIAQWHSMASAVVPPLSVEAMSRNMRWDGFFHLVVWTVTVAGIFLLWKASVTHRASIWPETLAGELLFGWGLFNLVEGVIIHHVLGLHHVRDQPVHVPQYDWIFLAVGGAGFLLLGWVLMRTGRHHIHSYGQIAAGTLLRGSGGGRSPISLHHAGQSLYGRDYVR